MRDVEIRPQRVAEIQLGVSEVPQQEIADAMIAAGADEEVGIRRLAELQLAREALLVDVLGGNAPLAASAARRRAACTMSQRPP